MEEVLKTTDWVTCPYDPNHRMRYSRFHNHFVKCKKAHPDDPRESCPYYASELIHPDDMKEHLIKCKYKNLYSDLCYNKVALPVYDAPCHINFDESDSETETVISIGDKDDRSSLFSGTTRRSCKLGSVISQPNGKFRKNNFFDWELETKSYAFECIDNNLDDSYGELLQPNDSGKYSCESSDDDSSSCQSTPCTSPSKSSGKSQNENRSPSSPSISATTMKPLDQRVGLGRGRVIQRLMSSSSSSLNSCGGGLGRGAWFRQRMNLD